MTGDVVKTVSAFASAGRFQANQPAMISVKTWASADVEPRGVLQLNHGMVEYIDRYDDFARAAATAGWLVVGMDYLGHGDSVDQVSQLGHTGLTLPGGGNVLLEDMDRLRRRTQERWPDRPYVMFGHSMGSFALRAYLAEHGDGLAGAVICGTATMSAGLIGLAKALLAVLGLVQAPDHRSKVFAAMSLGGYNKPFERAGGARTRFDWLSRDQRQVDQYVADPRCGGVFTLAADRVLMDTIAQANAPGCCRRTPRDLPLLLLSGEADPVGSMGRAAPALAQAYRDAGLGDVTVKLYPQARHELLNETNRADVSRDILDWLAGLTARR